MTPYVPSAGVSKRRSDVSFFVPLLLLTGAIGALVLTLPHGGFSLPLPNRVVAVLDRIPQPWKPPRPEHVLPPEVTAPEAAAVAVQAVAAPAVAAPAPPLRESVIAIQPSQPASAPANAGAAPATTEPAAASQAAAPVQAAAESAPHPAVAVPLPAAARLEGFRHQWQTWNNCGPAAITMATSFFGRAETQAQAAPFLKPNANDKNVGPDELASYARTLGLRADHLVAGDLERLKRLVANDIPVVVQQWFTPHPNDGMGHYRVIVGYDDQAQQLIAFDSYQAPGLNVRVPYGQFDADWRVFNRTYIPVYTPEKAEVAAAILGDDRDERALKQRSLARARDEVAARGNDPFAWFNLGTALAATGQTAEAVPAFDRARALRLPWRMLWYQFGPFEAYLAEGRLNDVLALTGANLQQANDLEESHYYRGRAQEAQGQMAQARASYQAAVRANPKYAPALHALSLLR